MQLKNLSFVILLFSTLHSLAQQQINPLLDSLQKEKDPSAFNKLVKQLEAGTEDQMEVLVRFYGRNETKADSLQAVLIKRFPRGRNASNAAQNQIVEAAPEKQEALFARYVKDFPNANADNLSFNVANNIVNINRDIPKALTYTKYMKDIINKITLGESILKYDPTAAEQFIKPELELAKQALIKSDAKFEYYAVAYTYSKILAVMGKNKEALSYAKEVYANLPRKNNALISHYANLLSLNGGYQEAFPLLEKLVLDGKSDDETRKQLEVSYKKLNPGTETASYFAALDEKLKASTMERVARSRINRASPNFRLQDETGKMVSLADFKGKTIVLDFWATWCGPCVKSFPAMQMAVDKYKDDPNVKFLFVHTLERVADPIADAKRFLTNNNYNFNLYMDIKNPVTKKNDTANSFGIAGIPTKIIVDGDGMIRFTTSGFSGGNDVVVAELSAMIDQAKSPISNNRNIKP
ncbi:TlpA family protein disulfide reductase [Pedobacter sp. MC2016-14]|uniref:TlpA family protein disulfide reductase n=1 Tax=Pedobacter sp. MC2016-14 TaxID=2897327 RepID=UPI001E386D0D|nr:TlpA disulfide reductase family protein [Pedobacter sp. MC2016-14]MCD0487778.1 TlpA family protein disulfide reductase [Pedobacter sp. MC2016-14]